MIIKYSMLQCYFAIQPLRFWYFYFKEEMTFIITKFKLVYIYISQIRSYIFSTHNSLDMNKQSQEIKSNFIFSFWNKAKLQKLKSTTKRSMWPICSIPRSIYYKSVWKWKISTYCFKSWVEELATTRYARFFQENVKALFPDIAFWPIKEFIPLVMDNIKAYKMIFQLWSTISIWMMEMP